MAFTQCMGSGFVIPTFLHNSWKARLITSFFWRKIFSTSFMFVKDSFLNSYTEFSFESTLAFNCLMNSACCYSYMSWLLPRWVVVLFSSYFRPSYVLLIFDSNVPIWDIRVSSFIAICPYGCCVLYPTSAVCLTSWLSPDIWSLTLRVMTSCFICENWVPCSMI